MSTSSSVVTKSATRETLGGRTLEYVLRVIQQPQRARACGSGAKSSADRRPVDPPPVVELRIYELGPQDTKTEVTFSYEANFFLFATLEVARPHAHARGQPQPPSQQVPVLTGMPVSGMAYLDRPVEAGYFIFPDLSVRHEGIYRLSFNLYEETKKLNDTDKDKSVDSKNAAAGGASPDASFDWRMEIKSQMFTVYSAKKFPGLAESTPLSRTVAEQGCRVRIRRDVRMRRREGKSNGDYDEAAEDDYSRGRPAEQEAYSRERTRSHSAGSDGGRSPYQNPPNQQQFAQQSYTPSPIAPHAVPHGTHLDAIFGPPGQFAAPPPQSIQPPQPTPQSYPQASYFQQGPPPPAPYRSEPPAQPVNNNYQPERQLPHSAHPSWPPREQRDSEPDRRASIANYPPGAPQPGPQYHPAVDTMYGRPPYHGYSRAGDSIASPQTLPPLKISSLDSSKYEGLSSPSVPLSSFRSLAPPLPSPIQERGPEQPSYYNQPVAPQYAQEPPRIGSKRGYEVALDSSSHTERLFNGLRPSSPQEDDEDEPLLHKMEYKRAGGEIIVRPAPEME